MKFGSYLAGLFEAKGDIAVHDKNSKSKNDINMLNNALYLSKHLADGRVRDITTGNIDYNNESSVYYILNPNNEELIVKSLKEAADIF
jgi:hypothetical protein